ncbi:MAG: DNA polymerase IV, partial [archaeon]
MSSPPSLRLIAHIDMDAFFASVEQRKHPEWGNDPVLVGVFTGRSEDSGVVSSASYSARKMGVRAGMPIFQAKNLCPSAHWVSVNHAEYSTISEQIFTRLFSFADVVELASIDEAYADLSIKAKGDFSAAESLLREFQTLVKKEWGLSCSVGLSVNKLVAKMASDARKPAGFTVVHPDEVSMFLDP